MPQGGVALGRASNGGTQQVGTAPGHHHTLQDAETTHHHQDSPTHYQDSPATAKRKQSEVMTERSEVMGRMEGQFDQLMDDIRDTNPHNILKRVSL